MAVVSPVEYARLGRIGSLMVMRGQRAVQTRCLVLNELGLFKTLNVLDFFSDLFWRRPTAQVALGSEHSGRLFQNRFDEERLARAK